MTITNVTTLTIRVNGTRRKSEEAGNSLSRELSIREFDMLPYILCLLLFSLSDFSVGGDTDYENFISPLFSPPLPPPHQQCPPQPLEMFGRVFNMVI